MKALKRNIIIGVAVLLLLGAGVAALLLIPADGDSPADASPDYPKGDLIDESLETVESVEINQRDGERYTIVNVDGLCDMLEKQDVFPYSEVYLASTFDYAVSQPGLRIVTEDVTEDQLEEFGLSDPSVVWTVNLKDGTRRSLQLGITNATKDAYYARAAGGGEVYALPSAAGNALHRPVHRYFDLNIMPNYLNEYNEDMTLTDTLARLRLQAPDGSVTEVVRRSDEELAASGGSTYRMLQPYDADANDYMIGEALTEKIKLIAPLEVVGEAAGRLQDYGLDDPYRLELEDTQGWSVSLLIGGTDDAGTGRYLMLEGSRFVLLDTLGDYGFLTEDPVRLRSTLAWLIDIRSVREVEYNLGDGSRTLSLDIRDDAESARLDGEEIDVQNARRLYMRTLDLTYEGADDTGDAGEFAYGITIRLRDGGERVMNLYRLNERHYLVELDGERTGFYTGVSKTQRLLEAFQMIDAGEAIPYN